jgi:hypothetical protein
MAPEFFGDPWKDLNSDFFICQVVAKLGNILGQMITLIFIRCLIIPGKWGLNVISMSAVVWRNFQLSHGKADREE